MTEATPHRRPGLPAQGAVAGAGRWPLRVSVASLTGPGHPVNQDSHASRLPDFFAVADGVGGGALGEVASALLAGRLAAVEAPSEAAVQQALLEADVQIAASLDARGEGAGAAVCAAAWRLPGRGGEWLAMVVGDCRLLQARRQWGRGWRLLWRSSDQTYAAVGLPPPAGVPADAPANMVGCGMTLPPQWHRLRLRPGDRLLLGSDGFFGVLDDARLRGLLASWPVPLPEDAARSACEAACAAGSTDDVTVLVVEEGGPASVRAAFFALLLVVLLLAAGHWLGAW